MSVHKTTFDFSHVLWLKIQSYCKAIGADQSKIARLALEKYIDDELDLNPGIKQRYDKQSTLLLAAAGNNIARIGERKKSRRKSSPSVEEGKEAHGPE